MPSRQQYQERIENEVVVTRHEVALAKGFLCGVRDASEHESSRLMAEYESNRGVQMPSPVLLHPSVDVEGQLEQVVGYIRCYLAFVEALWSLVYQGRFLASDGFEVTRLDVPHTDVIPGSGGSSGSWRFSSFDLAMPRTVVLAPSYRHDQSQFLSDPDVFALEAGIDGADDEVVEAAHDAVRCYRADLYRASATMLGKAMEGAWIELGWTLANAMPDEAPSKKDKTIEAILDEKVPLAAKIGKITSLYAEEATFGELRRAAGIRPGELNGPVVWSNAVREARNAIHFGVRPAPPNTYEKVGLLLIEGANSLKTLYRIVSQARVLWPDLADSPIKSDQP